MGTVSINSSPCDMNLLTDNSCAMTLIQSQQDFWFSAGREFYQKLLPSQSSCKCNSWMVLTQVNIITCYLKSHRSGFFFFKEDTGVKGLWNPAPLLRKTDDVVSNTRRSGRYEDPSNNRFNINHRDSGFACWVSVLLCSSIYSL